VDLLETIKISLIVIFVVKVSTIIVLRCQILILRSTELIGNAKIANTVNNVVQRKKKINFFIVINAIKLSILFAKNLKFHVYLIVDGNVTSVLNANFVNQNNFLSLSP